MRRFLFLAAFTALGACDSSPPKPPGNESNPALERPEVAVEGVDRSQAGKMAPETEFVGPEGETVRLADFEGTPLLVNLWATWCGPCIVEMPSLDALAEREGKALQVLALSQDTQRDLVTQFFGARRFNRLEPYLDAQLSVMTNLRIDTLPTTILYDAQGREVWRMTGMAEWDGERAQRLLREAGVE